MAHLQPHDPFNLAGFHHVCMMEGPDPEFRLSTLDYDNVCDENKRYREEIQRLTALLHKNKISYKVKPPIEAIKYTSKNVTNNNTLQKSSTSTSTTDPTISTDTTKSRLPTEILLRILSFALKSPEPVIDPFYKLCQDNVTKYERFSRSHLDINCLAVCHEFYTEGVRIFVENNDFVFTQAAALEHFAKVSTQARSTVKGVTLRVVGRYYDDKPHKLDLTGIGTYHDEVSSFNVPALGRPFGMIQNEGIQAYCWNQLADLLRALQLPRTADLQSKDRPKLLPNLTYMRIDLVNFCDHLPSGVTSFAAIVRWHLGQILDEIVVTGSRHEDFVGDEYRILRNLLRDGGLFSTAGPAFISVKSGLKSLPVGEYKLQVVRTQKKSAGSKKKSSTRKRMKTPTPIHPEGGKHPKSNYPTGTTVWKWAKEEDNGEKQWIEFDRESGRIMSEVERDREEEQDDPFWLSPLGVPPPLFIPENATSTSESDRSEFEGSDDEMPELVDKAVIGLNPVLPFFDLGSGH